MKRTLLLLALFGSAPLASAGGLDDEYLRLGGGFGSERVKGAVYGTVQAFAGADAVRSGPWRAGFEVAAIHSDAPRADGLGLSGVLNFAAAEDVSLFTRAGGDFGSDSGYLAGVGVGYFIERNMEVRMEWVARQAGSGWQFNLAWYPRLNPYP